MELSVAESWSEPMLTKGGFMVNRHLFDPVSDLLAKELLEKVVQLASLMVAYTPSADFAYIVSKIGSCIRDGEYEASASLREGEDYSEKLKAILTNASLS